MGIFMEEYSAENISERRFTSSFGGLLVLSVLTLHLAGDPFVRLAPAAVSFKAPPAAEQLNTPEMDRLIAAVIDTTSQVTKPEAKPATKPTIPEISMQRAAKAGFLPVMDWVCKAKQVPCEMLLALAQLETSTGVQETDDSSAQGLWQITKGQFIERALKYGARDRSTIEAYLQTLDPGSAEAVRTRRAYEHLVTGLKNADNPYYGEKKHEPFTKRVNEEILKARDGNLLIPALLVVDCLLDDLKYLAGKTGAQSEDVFQYTYLAHVYGGPAAARILGAYKDAGKTNQPIAPVLIAYYAQRYRKGHQLCPAERKQTENYVRKILVNNGNKLNVSVKSFVDGYTEKYLVLARGIKGQIHRN